MTIAFANLGASANPDINDSTDLASYANTSWTPPTSGLIIAFVVGRRVGGLDTPTMSGNGLTWTQIGVTLNCANGNTGLSLFGANASGSSVGATTIDFGGNTQTHCSVSFFHATGVDLSGGVVAAFVQQPTATGTGTTGTVPLVAAGSSDNRPVVAFTHGINEATTPRTNWTEVDDLAGTSTTRDLETQWRDDAFETTASATWATSDAWGGMAAELKAEVVTPPSPVSTSAAIPTFHPAFSGGEPTHELWLTTDTGVRIAQLTTGTTFQGSKVVNGIGWFAMNMPLSFDINLIRPDRMIQLWRQPSGGVMTLWNVYFLRKWIFSTQGSREVVTLEGPDKNDLLRRRIVAAFSGSAQATKTDFADDMMKEVVTQSIADGVAPVPSAGTRVWSNLSIQGDASAGPTITKSFPFDKLLSGSGSGVLSVLADAAREAGTEVFFSIEPNVVTGSSISFQFRTTINQPGQDVTSRVVFDQQRGNMREPSLEYDYSEEENYIYAAGQGEETARNIQQVYDTDRYNASAWNRCEGFADARNQTADNGVREAGRAQLEEGRPRIRASATPVDTAGTRFGIDWDFGDKVRWRYKNVEFDTIIRAVTISVENKREQVQARLDFEGLVS